MDWVVEFEPALLIFEVVEVGVAELLTGGACDSLETFSDGNMGESLITEEMFETLTSNEED